MNCFVYPQVADTEAVVSFKQLVAREFDVPEHCQRLVFRGKTLAGKPCAWFSRMLSGDNFVRFKEQPLVVCRADEGI